MRPKGAPTSGIARWIAVGGAHRARGFVAVRDRRAEDRHHRVADVLVDAAAEALDDRVDGAEVALEQRVDVFGVEPLARAACSRRGRRTAR